VANGRLLLGDDQIPFTPALYGLLDTATELPELDRHWQQGFTWEPLCASGFSTYAQCLVVVDSSDVPSSEDVPEPPEKEASTDWSVRGATPFAAVAEVDCSPASGPERIRARANQALIRSEGRTVEAAFWTGLAGGQGVVWPHLAAASDLTEPGAGGALLQPAVDVLNSGAATELVTGLALLESALGDCYDGVGTIHVPRVLVPIMSWLSLITTRAGQITTQLGTKVAAGRGYPGTSPTGTDGGDSGVQWIYATGEVFYRRGEVFQPTTVESFDRSRNTVRAVAERPYVIGWDCCLLGIPIAIEEGS
jgi:hypothetical protein